MAGWKASRTSRSGIRGMKFGGGGPASAAMLTMVYGWERGGQFD